MKLLIFSSLLLCCVAALAVSLEDNFEIPPLDKLDNEFDYFPDDGTEEKLFTEAIARFEGDALASIAHVDDEAIEDALARFKSFHKPRKPHKKRRRRRRRFPRRLRVQLKAFRASGGRASYKVYVLQGRNIRHYRVRFSRSQQFRFRKRAQRRTRRCIFKAYMKRCFKLPLFFKGFCTTKVTKKCMGSFETFEIANPKTRGKDKVKPRKKRGRKPKKPAAPKDPEPPTPAPPVNGTAEDPVITPEPEEKFV